jgi:predicted AAA+ superfamily ATPase
MPKLFFMDLGVRNMATDNFDWLESRMDKGMLLENLVFKLLNDREDVKRINFWRTQSKREVDFIIDQRFAFEVKYNGLKFDPGKYSSFRETYPHIPLGVVNLINPMVDSFAVFDLV